MLKEQMKVFTRLLMLMDLFVVGCAIAMSINFQAAEIMMLPKDYYSYYEYTLYIFGGALFWVAALQLYDGYASFRKISYKTLVWQVFQSVFVATLTFETILFIFDSKMFSPKLIISIFGATLLFLLLERSLLLCFLHMIRKRDYNYRQLIIIGSGNRAKHFAQILQNHKEWGLRLIGFVDEPEKVGQEIDGKYVIGSFDNLEQILDNTVVDEVAFCLPRKWMDRLEEYIIICEKVGVKVNIALDFFNTTISTPKLTNLGKIPLLCLESTPSYGGPLFIKRVIDIVISATLLPVLSPLFILIVLAIKLTSPGPVFFGQERCGLNGRRFTMLKFRTMILHADKLKTELAHLNEVSGPVFKIENDPRLIPMGKFLRKFSLDELPQLFNVLKGDMSIVGPRPPVPSEVQKYDRWQRRRLSLRPGLTCLWQINGRNKVRFEDWVKLDLEYIDNWSLLLDLKIILKTIGAVLSGTGV